MIYFVQQFDAAPGISEDELREVFAEAGRRWGARYPEFQLAMFLAPRFRSGARPHYTVLWSLGRIGVLDEWIADRGKYPELVEIEAEFVRVTHNVEAKIVHGTHFQGLVEESGR